MKKLILMTAAATLLLTGCLIPEKFTSSVSFNEDGSYTTDFDGTVVYGLYLEQKATGGKISASDEKFIKNSFEEMGKEKGVKSVRYTGNGRGNITVIREAKPGEPTNLFDFIKVGKNRDGSYFVSTPILSKQNINELKQLNLNLNGKLDVILPKNAKILKSNADSGPGLFSKAYSWKIENIDKAVQISFRLK